MGSGHFTEAALKEKAAQLMIRDRPEPRTGPTELEGMTMVKNDKGKSIGVQLKPEDIARIHKVVNDHHQHSEAVLNPRESPEARARFKAIGGHDEVTVPGLSLCKDELLALVKFWENRVRHKRFDQWYHRMSSTSAMRMEATRDDLIEKVAAQIGIEAVWQAIDEAFDEFERVEIGKIGMGFDGPALWRSYLADSNGKPADPEALAERARLDKALGGELEPVNSTEADDNLSTP